MAYQIGDHVGDYEITGILGAGGMGKVYQVKNLLTGRIEAMKVLLPDLTGNQEIADRFLREIRVLGSLEHPNIAELRTAQRIDNQVLMVMECIEGKPLDVLMQRGALKREFGLNFMAQVLGAIEYAHAHGVIHRDIKPSNIMVTPAGQVKLMDFGIAKLAADRKLTVTGGTLGSLYYMSPEQIQGAESVDARSDIYSVGICLYEISTGQRPFDATSEYSLMSAHLNEAPRPPIQIDDKIPESLNEIILMAIAKEPARRFQSAKAMLAALNGVRQQLGIDTDTQPYAASIEPVAATTVAPPMQAAVPKSRRGLYMALGSLATAAVVVGALLLAPRYFRTAATATQAPAPAAQITPAPAPLTTPAAASAPDRVPAPGAAPRQVPTAIQRTGVPVPASLAAPPPTAPAQIAPAQPAAQQTAAPPVSAQNTELNEIREQYNQLVIRSTTTKAGLESLQNQMGGMGLRADMRETAVRMDYLMRETLNSLHAGDAEGARRNLDLADRAVVKLEKFLGR